METKKIARHSAHSSKNKDLKMQKNVFYLEQAFLVKMALPKKKTIRLMLHKKSYFMVLKGDEDEKRIIRKAPEIICDPSHIFNALDIRFIRF